MDWLFGILNEETGWRRMFKILKVHFRLMNIFRNLEALSTRMSILKYASQIVMIK